MKIYKEFALILFFCLISILIKDIFKLNIPASILGFIFMFISLELKFIKISSVENVSSFLLDNLSIFFIPAGVSLMNIFYIIKPILLKISIIAIISTILTIITAALVADFIKNKIERK